ncbi:MAG TPA: hypothetical protein VHE55_14415 [Fimbriimonadaceae bacterium]|nr:hypothetical protein [Fimbriimonadaceae bacterium]
MLNPLMQDTGLKVFRQKGDAELIERRTDGDDLLENVRAPPAFFNHFLKTADLAGDPGKALSGIGF